MSAVRRSARLRSKEEQFQKELEEYSKRFETPQKRQGSNKQRRGSNSSSCSQAAEGHEVSDSDSDDALVAVTPRNTWSHKTNNFLGLYNSYNRDYGYDLYEGEFIDDSEALLSQTPKRDKRKQRTTKQLEKEANLSDSSDNSDVGVRRSRCKKAAVQMSSDEELSPNTSNHDDNETKTFDTNKNINPNESNVTLMDSDDSDFECNVKRRSVNRSRLDSYLTESSDEEGKVDRRSRKKRRVQRPESDEELSLSPVRKTSNRSERLKQEKLSKRDTLLRRLKNNNGSKSPSSENDLTEPSDTPYIVIPDDSPKNLSGMVQDSQLLGERILFPVISEESSDEESDWIVSDGEDDYDVTEFIDVELMKGVHSAVLMKERANGGSVEGGGCAGVEGGGYEGVEEVDSAIRDGVEAVTHKEDDLQTQLLTTVTSDDSITSLTRLLPQTRPIINRPLLEGHTALMLAALRGDTKALTLLLEHGADINCSDDSGTTSLHLAALVGCVECVEMLILWGHTVDCQDRKGWSPLLYAHFKDHQDCVLALMKARPQQLSVLSDLLKCAPEEGTEARRKTVKVVRSLLVSLAHHETYYSLFNQFISENLSVLDEDGFGFMSHCMGLLSFENKQSWLKGKLDKLREYARATLNGHTYGSQQRVILSDVPRDKVLEAVRDRLGELMDCPERCWLQSLFVTFKGEAGICTGPRKEFWACLSKAVASRDKLFKLTDGGHISLQPCSLFKTYPELGISPPFSQRHCRLIHLVAMVMAYAVFHGDTLDLSLSKPILKKLVGEPLTHPEDLEDVDQTLYHTLTTSLQDDIIDDMELTFTATVQCPWNNRTADISLREGGRDITVTRDNKEDYIHDLSQFKLDTSIAEEMSAFLSGFWKVIPRKCLEVFKPNELALLLSGVPTINMEDWYNHTQYLGVSASDNRVVWFWRLVTSLKQEEKALLLKFSTGSPCVPPGGFSQLSGLSGPTPFTIMIMPGRNKIPQASTCFNQLKLSDFSCEQELRNKVLIAIRYGCEGFAFS